MVCQAASRTRFRALKYVNGIAGKPTIVVRVIACFQPMEDCQVVVIVGRSRQHSSHKLPKLSSMSSSLEPRQKECLPACINPGTCLFSVSKSMPGSLVPGINPDIHVLPENIAMPGSADISVLKTERKYHSDELLRQLFLCFPTSLPSPGSYLNELRFLIAKGHSGRSTAIVVSGNLQKESIVFYQSGNRTRLICGLVHPRSQHKTTAITERASDLDLHETQAVKTNPFTPPSLQEEYDESEMHEDTEEINALLYSDDDYYDDDDEVMSTDHSPIGIKQSYQSEDHVDDIMEEVASSDGPNKRQKLVNDGHKQSIMVDAACSVKLKGSHEFDSDAESSYAIGHNQREELDYILRNKQSKKDKIRITLKILESIIPGAGAKGKNPLLILDESIDYIKSLKLQAKT